MWDALAGICVGLGYFMFMTGTPVVSKAVGWIFGSSSLLLSVVMGVLVFKGLGAPRLEELKGKSSRILAHFQWIEILGILVFVVAASSVLHQGFHLADSGDFRSQLPHSELGLGFCFYSGNSQPTASKRKTVLSLRACVPQKITARACGLRKQRRRES